MVASYSTMRPTVRLGLANFSKVPFRFVSAQGQELGDASKAVVGLLRNCW